MSSRRIAKVAEALRECVSTTILFGLKDPRVKNVTVLRTEVSPDLKSARVYVSVLGEGESVSSLTEHGAMLQERGLACQQAVVIGFWPVEGGVAAPMGRDRPRYFARV